MEEIKTEIANHKILGRWQSLEDAWTNSFKGIDAIVIKDGIDEEGVIKLKTLALQSWLFRFEFINSIIVISKKTLIILTSKEKLEML